MSRKTYDVFQAVENKATVLANYWDNFQTEIIRHLPESYHPEIQELSSNLEVALEKLIDELRHPTLILATTGTTSSGKSTLVNFLCGADIVPTAVSEMSAGSVTIEYSEEKALIIQETSGALWECSEWKNISEEEICERLEQVMISYIDNKEEQPNLAHPKFIIYYPFRLFKEYEQDLPRGVRVKLLDLPGLSYVGDDRNMDVIKQCREALCLVTYNSQENDPQKVKSLLLQVVEEVKGLGGSPERMLFILNKIDVFREDRNWIESEQRFVEKTVNNIKAELIEQLGEYTKEIEQLQVVKLSTRPALLSLGIQNFDENLSIKSCRDARKYCAAIIEDILEELPGSVYKWVKHDRERIGSDLWHKSYAEEFQQYLNEHITQHFPKLVIPQAIDRFNVAAGNSIAQWAVHTTTAILNSSEENYQQECERISSIKSSLDQFLQVSDTNLRKPFEEMNQKCEEYLSQPNTEDLARVLEVAVEELQKTKPYNKIEEKLIPLYDWREALGRGVDQILEAVAESLDKGRVNLDNPNFKKVDINLVNVLESNLRRLIRLNYSYSTAIKGDIIEAKTQEDKDKLKDINSALNELSSLLNLIIVQVLDKISKQEINRMYEAVSELFKCHLSYLEQCSNEIAPDIVIRFPDSELNKVTKEFTFKPKFESGFDITTKEYTVQYRTWKHWLWIVPKKEKRSSDNAVIPSTGEIQAKWSQQLKQVEPEMLKQVIEWLVSQMNDLKKNVDTTQNAIFNLYLDRLEKARQKIDLNFEKQKNVWEPMQQRAQNLAGEFSQLVKFEEEETDLSET